MLHAVHLKTVRLERASLSERLLAEIAFVGSHSSVGSCVSLQVEGVVEAFAAECTQVTFHVGVTFHVTVEQSLECEVLRADATAELAAFLFGRRRC